MQGFRFSIEKSLHSNSDLSELFDTGLLDDVLSAGRIFARHWTTWTKIMQRRLLRQTTKAMVIFNYIFALTRIRIVTDSISGYLQVRHLSSSAAMSINFQARTYVERPGLSGRLPLEFSTR